MVVPITLINPSRSSSGGSSGEIIDETGSTGDAYTSVFLTGSPGGMMGIGTIKNTGSDSMNVRETVVDKFGSTAVVVKVLAAGDEYLLDPQTNFDDTVNLALPPFVSYEVEVQSLVAGVPTTFEAHFLSLFAVAGPIPEVVGPAYGFTYPGDLVITNNVAIPWAPGIGSVVRTLVGVVKTPPAGDDIILTLSIGTLLTGAIDAVLGTVTIADGAYSQTQAITPVFVGTDRFLQLEITQIGNPTPGANLTALARG